MSEAAAIALAEPVPEPEIRPPAPEPAEQSPQSPASKRGGSGMLPLVLGGVVAGAVGFVVAISLTGDGRPFGTDTTAIDTLRLDLTVMAEETSSLRSEIARLEQLTENVPSGADVADLGVRQDQAAALTTGNSAQLKELAGRLADLENRPISEVGTTADAVATYERELAAMRQMFADEMIRIEAAQAASATERESAAIQSQDTARQMAMANVRSALDSGRVISGPLAQLRDSCVEITAELSRLASNTVATLVQLQDQFPEAARTSLNAAIRAEADDGTANRVSAFLKSQLGVRSLGPRDGNDPDAILSRAEEALRTADIAGALGELAVLPDAAQPGMADWIKLAQGRQAVVEAVNALSADLGN